MIKCYHTTARLKWPLKLGDAAYVFVGPRKGESWREDLIRKMYRFIIQNIYTKHSQQDNAGEMQTNLYIDDNGLRTELKGV